MPAPLSLKLPIATVAEIERAAARCERSVGFLILGALKSASSLSGEPVGERVSFALRTDDEDPRDLVARSKKLAAEKAPKRAFDDAVALAWQARREQILAWVEKIAKVNEGEKSDDLDEGLRIAADPATEPDKLVDLAKSEYPRVRALVAAHRGSPMEALELMKNDRERIVREALIARR